MSWNPDTPPRLPRRRLGISRHLGNRAGRPGAAGQRRLGAEPRPRL